MIRPFFTLNLFMTSAFTREERVSAMSEFLRYNFDMILYYYYLTNKRNLLIYYLSTGLAYAAASVTVGLLMLEGEYRYVICAIAGTLFIFLHLMMLLIKTRKFQKKDETTLSEYYEEWVQHKQDGFSPYTKTAVKCAVGLIAFGFLVIRARESQAALGAPSNVFFYVFLAIANEMVLLISRRVLWVLSLLKQTQIEDRMDTSQGSSS